MKHIKNIAKRGVEGIIYDNDISLLFEGWKGRKEKIIILGPHDDDPLIGAGMLIYALRQEGIDIRIAIMTDGSKGYCRAGQKNEIISIRKRETESAYETLGIGKSNIKWFELPDSDTEQHAWKWETVRGAEDGLIAQMIKYFREINATRFILPNENDFHIDHKVTFEAGLYCAIQASEPIVPDFGKNSRRDTILRYGVWSPFKGMPSHSARMSEEALMKKVKAVREYKSQMHVKAIVRALEGRGPFEFFQEYIVAPYPSADYEMHFWGRQK
jgi:LmbE family N-acetylglucosaminyl deacetylase